MIAASIYEVYLATKSADPYSVWLGDQWRAYFAEHGLVYVAQFSRHTGPMRVLVETRAEWTSRMRVTHQAHFRDWLRERHAEALLHMNGGMS